MRLGWCVSTENMVCIKNLFFIDHVCFWLWVFAWYDLSKKIIKIIWLWKMANKYVLNANINTASPCIVQSSHQCGFIWWENSLKLYQVIICDVFIGIIFIIETIICTIRGHIVPSTYICAEWFFNIVWESRLASKLV